LESLLATVPPPYELEMLADLAFLKESELKAALELVEFLSEFSEQEKTKNNKIEYNKNL
jgi:hypothetical protein